jgi:hypothetical protein
MSTFFTLADLKTTPLKNTPVNFVKVYVKEKNLKYLNAAGEELDVVLDRPLENFTLPGTASPVTSSDTIATALGKIQATLDSAKGLGGTSYVYVPANGTPSENGQQLLEGYQLAASKVTITTPTLNLGELEFFNNESGSGWYSSLISRETLEPYISNGQLYTGNFLDLNIVGYESTSWAWIQESGSDYVVSFYGGVKPPDGVAIISNFYYGVDKSTLVVGPGYYEFDGEFLIDENHVNVVSLTGNMDVYITNTTGEIGLSVSAENILVRGISTNTQAFEVTNSNAYNNRYEKCQGGNYSFGSNGVHAVGIYIDCVAQNYSFGSLGGNAQGEFKNCKAFNYSFGGSDDPVFESSTSGTFTDCRADNDSFGTTFSGGTFLNCVAQNNSFGGGQGAVADGAFTNCRGGGYCFGGLNGVASGIFTNCEAQVHSFGGDSANGTFTNCIAGSYSFGGNQVNGYFYNCRASEYSFGFNENCFASGLFVGCIGGFSCFGSALGSNANGTFIDCTGNAGCFGANAFCGGNFTKCVAGDGGSFGGGSSGVAANRFNYCIGGENAFGGGGGQLTGVLSYCRLTTGTFPTVSLSGKTRYCLDGSDTTNNQG